MATDTILRIEELRAQQERDRLITEQIRLQQEKERTIQVESNLRLSEYQLEILRLRSNMMLNNLCDKLPE